MFSWAEKKKKPFLNPSHSELPQYYSSPQWTNSTPSSVWRLSYSMFFYRRCLDRGCCSIQHNSVCVEMLMSSSNKGGQSWSSVLCWWNRSKVRFLFHLQHIFIQGQWKIYTPDSFAFAASDCQATSAFLCISLRWSRSGECLPMELDCRSLLTGLRLSLRAGTGCFIGVTLPWLVWRSGGTSMVVDGSVVKYRKAGGQNSNTQIVRNDITSGCPCFTNPLEYEYFHVHVISGSSSIYLS